MSSDRSLEAPQFLSAILLPGIAAAVARAAEENRYRQAEWRARLAAGAGEPHHELLDRAALQLSDDAWLEVREVEVTARLAPERRTLGDWLGEWFAGTDRVVRWRFAGPEDAAGIEVRVRFDAAVLSSAGTSR